MNQKSQSRLAFLLFVGIFFAIYVIIERVAIPPVKEMGVLAHYGLPLVWSIIITLLLWISLERAYIIPRTMSLRSWARQEWSPARVYSILIVLFLISSGLAAYFYFMSSREFLVPFVVASFSAVPLLFYWLYRRGIVYLVAGLLSLLLGLYMLGAAGIGALKIHDEPAPAVLLGLFIVYALFFCYTGFVLIRKWRRPTGLWLGSWRSFVWGYLLVVSFSLVGLGIMSILQLKGAFVSAIPIGIYLFFYTLGKFLSSVGTRNEPSVIDSYTTTINPGNFIHFALADRSKWEESRQQVTDQRVTFSSLTGSLFDVLAFLAVIATFAVFHDASIAQQTSFALLVITFHIAANLSEYSDAGRNTLAKIRARLEQELTVAHDMQMGLMPKLDPIIAGFDIAAICVPAHEVGGDFYDYIWLDEKKSKLGIAVADVSGNAMKAAMTAVLTSGMLYSEVQKSKTPREVLAKINHPLYLRTDRRVFTALAFAVLDTRKKFVTYSSAGQTPPVLVRNKMSEELRVKGMRLPLGLQDNLKYCELKLKLRKKDLFVLFTDGVVEAMNSKKEMYGFERLKETLAQCDNLSSAGVRDRILQVLKDFSGTTEQHDDMTVVVVRVL